MKIKETIRIDVSKATLDVHIHSTGDKGKFDNNPKGFRSLTDWAFLKSPFPQEQTLFIFEHTGLYSHNLSAYLAAENLSCRMVSGLEVKHSLGIARGKNDQVDTKRIAIYALCCFS